MTKEITYTKTRKVSFPVTGVTFKNIPVLKNVRLSFFEKYVILLLQQGVKAHDKRELVTTISDLLNVSSACVADFISYLDERRQLIFDSYRFTLSPAVHYTMDKRYDNAMFAELDVKMADCNKIVFVNGLNSFFLDEDFKPAVFQQKGTADQKAGNAVSSAIPTAMKQNKEQLITLLDRSFSKSNMHLQQNSDFSLDPNSSRNYQLEFEALIDYKYFPDKKTALKQKFTVQSDNCLPEDFINNLLDSYTQDDKLPRFIELDEDLYQKLTPGMEAYEALDREIESIQTLKAPITTEISQAKIELAEKKKEFQKAEREETGKSNQIKKDIAAKESEIRINEQRISSGKTGDEALIRSLQNAIAALNKEKQELVGKLSEQDANIQALTDQFKATESRLNNTITAQELVIRDYDASIKDYQNQQKEVIADFDDSLKKNAKQFNPVIKKTLDLYPSAENILYRFISDICVYLDCAVSASEVEAYDEVSISIDKMREMYRKVLQAIFETIDQKQLRSLGSYFEPMNITSLEGIFNKKKISLTVKNNLETFHGLANALGHSSENGPQKKSNEQRIARFKEGSKDDREKVLLSLPNFFSALHLDKKELTAVLTKLKV